MTWVDAIGVAFTVSLCGFMLWLILDCFKDR